MEELFKEISKEVIKIRKILHEIPEIGFHEFKTSDFIKKKLKEYGYRVRTVARTGVLAFVKGKNNHKAVAVRADMDGLMINEKTGLSFSSKNEGRMHACGHDGHMAILLGLAMYLSKIGTINRDVLLIFQPAEEGPGGAKVIVDEGILDDYNVECIFGLHIFPEIDEGKIGIVSGPLMAQNGEFDINIQSIGCHGAMPHLGTDGIYIASEMIGLYQSIVSRNINPNEGAVLTIGKIFGGEARNVIANSVKIEGTIRAFNTEVYDEIKDRMIKINKGIGLMYNVNIDMEIRDFYPPVINDKDLYSLVKNNLNPEEIVEIEPMMLAEDFSYYQQVRPGFFFMLGSRNESIGYIYPLHSSKFNFNEKILFHGIKTYIKILKSLDVII
ncbi:amidohydrolase [Clostridium sp. D2Q-14]|uniref:M20 metallopeptidase family protein n=1 Tax=Anaeromonas gelatinilytica TaxID=2683194 RepID=UPI00193AE972|nr:M20 family metallopeptidase [Anaeromonas gelatinilytica]MBS4534645.1 amidohydrolase [Anaeromonas gelatinilytica]